MPKTGSAVAKSKKAGALASSGKSRKAAEVFSGHQGLTTEQFEAVKAYQGHQYKPINDFLRGDRPNIIPSIKAHVPHLDTLTGNARINRDIRLFRGFKLTGVGSLGADPLALAGKTISDASFASASLNRTQARKFGALVVEFVAPAGTKGLAVHQIETGDTAFHKDLRKEREVLLPRGSSLKIISVSRRKDGTYHAKAELSQ